MRDAILLAVLMSLAGGLFTLALNGAVGHRNPEAATLKPLGQKRLVIEADGSVYVDETQEDGYIKRTPLYRGAPISTIQVETE